VRVTDAARSAGAVPPVTEESAGSPRRWLVCGLLFAATAINYSDRQILSLIKPLLDQSLHWTNEQFGWVNAAFQGAYGVGMLAAGYGIDRFGTRLCYAAAVAWWSCAALAHSLIGSVRGFVWARIALGLGESGNFPCAVKSIAAWFPARERALATGLFNSGSNVGAIVAPALVPWVAATWGWRAAFVICGSAGFVWVGLWLLLYRRAPIEPKTAAGDGPDVAPAIPWRRLLRYRQAWSFIVAKFLLDPAWWFFLIWLPDYFKQTRGLDLKLSWKHLVTIYALTTVLGIAGSWLSGWWIGRGWTVTRARKTAMALFAVSMLPIAFISHFGNWAAVGVLGFACAAVYAYTSNMFSTISDMFPRGSIASVFSLGGAAGCLSGMIFPVFCGRILDASRAGGHIASGYGLLFTLCAASGLLAFGLSHWLAPRFEPIAAGA
jgi:ACS family hexuronate transporter-like MFS transporter